LGGGDQGIHQISTPGGRRPEGPGTDFPSDAAISQQRSGSQLESQLKAQGNIDGGGIAASLQKMQFGVQKPPYQCQALQASLSHDSPVEEREKFDPEKRGEILGHQA
jgi:hypothetical protein